MTDENDNAKKHFNNQLGITAHVRRSTEGGTEEAFRANRALNDIGDFVHANTATVQGLEYAGSAAVHIYFAPALGQMVFITQTEPLRETNELMAGAAFTQLKKDLMTRYGHKATKVRSGF